MAVAKITGDIKGFTEDCRRGIRRTLDKLIKRARIEYQRKSLEYATVRDPWDKEVHERTMHLIEAAASRKEREEE
jgi:hypothetical protein